MLMVTHTFMKAKYEGKIKHFSSSLKVENTEEL